MSTRDIEYLLMDIQSFLKHSSSLYAAGFNERNAQDCPRKRDETGVTAKQYAKEAEKLIARSGRLRRRVQRQLATIAKKREE